MAITTNTISLDTAEGVSITDITDMVAGFVAKSNMRHGNALVFTRHTTTGVMINENEKRLMQDVKNHFERVAPSKAKYLHDDLNMRDCPPDERINGHSHIKSLAAGASQCVPVMDGKMMLGKWQKILFFEFDGARRREIIIQVWGEQA